MWSGKYGSTFLEECIMFFIDFITETTVIQEEEKIIKEKQQVGINFCRRMYYVLYETKRVTEYLNFKEMNIIKERKMLKSLIL